MTVKREHAEPQNVEPDHAEPQNVEAGPQWPGPVPTASRDDEVTDDISMAVDQLEAAVTALLSIDPTALPSARLLAVLTDVETQSRRLPAVRHGLVIELGARRVPADHGVRSTSALLRKALRLGPGEAKAWVGDAERLSARRALTTGEALPPRHPATAAAQAAGSLSGEHLRLITATLHRLPTTLSTEEHSAVEQLIVALARGFHPGPL